MSLPTSRLSYGDCFEVYDKCLESARGIRIRMPDRDVAWFFRMRLHMARSIDRKENKAIYEKGEPMHGCSLYDPIAIRIRTIGDECWVYLEPITSINLEIEPIEGDIPKLEYKPQLQITVQREPEPVSASAPVKRRV